MSRFNKHIIIVGTARSGTSWFSEIIALQHRYRMLFEPEHEFNTRRGTLICDRYMTLDTKTAEIDTYLKHVFANRVDCDWIGQISNRKWKRHLWPIIPKKIIIKFVRCNLSAKFMAEHYQIPVVFMIRNPYDVLASQQQVKFPWLYDLSWFQGQDKLCALIFDTYGFDLRQNIAFSDLEKLCIRWCVENTIPFLDGGEKSFEVYKYEEVKGDINLFLNFCKTHNLEPLKAIDSAFSKPSSKTHPNSSIITGTTKSLNFNKSDYKLINSYLDLFKINAYERQIGI